MQKSIMLILAGVAIGLLVAPEKGEKTQRKLSNWLSGHRDRADAFLDDAASSARSGLRSAKRGIEEQVSDVKQEFRAGRNEEM